MPALDGSRDHRFYRVRIKEGHSATGLLVSASGKRCIPSTQYCLTVDSRDAYRFPRSAALHVQVRLGEVGSRRRWKKFRIRNNGCARPAVKCSQLNPLGADHPSR